MLGGDVEGPITKSPERHLPVSLATKTTREVCTGLEYARAGGIIHRGTKPGNVMLGTDRTAMSATFLCYEAMAPTTIKQKVGRIVDTYSGASSSRVSSASATGTVYGTARAAVEHFSRALACELGKYNIVVNCYLPAQDVAIDGHLVNLPATDRSNRLDPNKL